MVERLSGIAAETQASEVEAMTKSLRAEVRDELLKMGIDLDLETEEAVAEATQRLLARLGGQQR